VFTVQLRSGSRILSTISHAKQSRVLQVTDSASLTAFFVINPGTVIHSSLAFSRSVLRILYPIIIFFDTGLHYICYTSGFNPICANRGLQFFRLCTSVLRNKSLRYSAISHMYSNYCSDSNLGLLKVREIGRKYIVLCDKYQAGLMTSSC
jgi:hypothetical protein